MEKHSPVILHTQRTEFCGNRANILVGTILPHEIKTESNLNDNYS
jgi:hypothetical protein